MLRLRPKEAVSESSSNPNNQDNVQILSSEAKEGVSLFTITCIYKRFSPSTLMVVCLGLGYLLGSSRTGAGLNHTTQFKTPVVPTSDSIETLDATLNSKDDTTSTLSSNQLTIQCPPHRTLTTTNQTYPEFIHSTLQALHFASLEISSNTRPIDYLVKHYDQFPSLPNGFWAEFGVYYGWTLQLAHKELKKQSSFQGILAGFDSFEGLPEKWREDFEKGNFGIKGLYQRVRRKLPQDVELYKGWFQDTIPTFKKKHATMPAAVIHHDGDLFLSTTITLQMLDDRIQPGTHMIFDELIGYPEFEKHEIFALWLWMEQHSGVKLCAMGHMGEIDSGDRRWTSPVVDVDPNTSSAWFQVISF